MIRKVVERERIESDHIPLEVELEAQMEETKNKKKILKRQKETIGEEEIAEYKEKCEEWNCTETENEDIWRKLKEKVKSSNVSNKSKEENNTPENLEKESGTAKDRKEKKIFKKNVQRIKKGENRLEGMWIRKEGIIRENRERESKNKEKLL